MKNSFWHEIPLVRLLIPFVVGIATSMFVTVNLTVVLGAFAMLIIAYFLCTKWIMAYSKRWLTGVLGILLFYVLGIVIHLFQNQKLYTNHFTNQPALTKILLQLTEPPLLKANSIQLKTTALLGKINPTEFIKTNGEIIVYLAKNNNQQTPKYGDLIWINASDVKPIEQPKNPYEFNYKRYLEFNQIFAQAYIKRIENTNINLANQWMNRVYQCQDYFKWVIQTYIIDANAVGVAQALLYGNDNEIDKEIMFAYANTGTLHVLAVSGMHVGLIYYILTLLLFFLNRNQKTKLIKQLTVLICLWIYSVLCGLSPSILRATVMISFIIIAGIINRRSNVYNTLAASCLFILMFDVNTLANVGFQLSYLAVLGIVFIQPMLYKWYQPQTKMGVEVWKICTVSVAAQLTTTPLGMLYFHQFPNCFLFSNLLIIPLTTVVLYACILLLVVSKITALAVYLGKGIMYVIVFTNQLVKWVEGLPYAYINGIEISIGQAVLLYFILFVGICYFMYQYKMLLYACLIATWILSLSFLVNELVGRDQKSIWIYATNHDFAAGVYQHKTGKLLLSKGIQHNADKFRFHLQQHIWHLKLNYVDTITVDSTNWMILSGNNQTIAIAGVGYPAKNIKSTVLVIKNMIDLNLIEKINPKRVVLAGRISTQYKQRLIALCAKKNIVFYDTQKSGAIELLL